MSKTTLDLSTLSDITDGTHTVKVKAKASGYNDSEFSNEVSYTKASGYRGHVTTDRFNLHIYGIDSNGNETLIADEVQSVTVSGYTKYRVNIGNTSSIWNFSVSKTNCTYDFYENGSGTYYGRNWDITASGEFTFDITVT